MCGVKLLLRLLIKKRRQRKPRPFRGIAAALTSAPNCAPGSYAHGEIRACGGPGACSGTGRGGSRSVQVVKGSPWSQLHLLVLGGVVPAFQPRAASNLFSLGVFNEKNEGI